MTHMSRPPLNKSALSAAGLDIRPDAGHSTGQALLDGIQLLFDLASQCQQCCIQRSSTTAVV